MKRCALLTPKDLRRSDGFKKKSQMYIGATVVERIYRKGKSLISKKVVSQRVKGVANEEKPE